MNWKTTFGGLLTAFGHTLMGTGVVPSLAGIKHPVLLWTAFLGFIISAFGSAWTGIFAADKICPKPDCPLKTINQPKGPVL